ncbi:MAG: hypothetical protein ACO1RX_12840 [Candidatus Sericytochromatia bacterium]
MNEILTRTWKLLQGNWILLSVLMLETLVLLIFKGGQMMFSGNAALEMALFFLHMAVLAGWTYQMKAVMLRPEHRTNWDDFFTGVARYFTPLMVGGAVFLGLCLTGLLLSVMLGQALVGLPDDKILTEMGKLVQQEKTSEILAFLQKNPVALEQMQRWALVVFSGLLVLAGFASTLFFWTQWVVLGDLAWNPAWRHSQRTVFRHWRPLLLLSLIWGVPTLLLQAGLFLGDVVALVAFLGSLVLKTYFSLLFCQFLLDREPEAVTPLLDTSAQGKA